ncbi:MAG: patatin-like phospholipase family protein [Zoogloeaceae bacterium]|nr:patatin-like phospholipase family protein [Zoogloeaceae bacterium]
MAYKRKSLRDHFAVDGDPKRILALDGGGLRGILTVGALARLEALLRDRHGGDPDFRLSHYFDLIAGTSTGAIIAAALALGWTVEQVRQQYFSLGQKVFEKSLLRRGLLRAKYDHEALAKALKRLYGAKTTLGGGELQTGLLVVTKRLDSGSPWPIGNNPMGMYFAGRDGGTVGNGDYPLWQVVRASTAAPSFFDPEEITIARKAGQKPASGQFVDGGVSPFNNPSLQALMYATVDGYRVGWPLGADRVLLVSLGTGAADPAVERSAVAAKHAVAALASLMNDCAVQQETLLQWLSASPTARVFDREIGDLSGNLAGPEPLLSYLRYNVTLNAEGLDGLLPQMPSARALASLSAMDAPDNMDLLHAIGVALGKRDLDPEHFPPGFDLKP